MYAHTHTMASTPAAAAEAARGSLRSTRMRRLTATMMSATMGSNAVRSEPSVVTMSTILPATLASSMSPVGQYSRRSRNITASASWLSTIHTHASLSRPSRKNTICPAAIPSPVSSHLVHVLSAKHKSAASVSTATHKSTVERYFTM